MSRIQIYCCVTGCPNSAMNKLSYSFFAVPTDSRRDEWLRLIRREDLKDSFAKSKCSKVCEEHFSPDTILLRNKRKILKKSAVPSLCLPTSPSKIKLEIKTEVDIPEPTSSQSIKYLTSKLTQTDKDWDYEMDLSKVSKGTPSVIDCHFTFYRNKFYDLCNKCLTKDLTSLIKATDSFKQKSITSNEDEYSQFCFKLYQNSPQASHFFESVYDLPKSDVLLKQYVKVGTIIDDAFMCTIKSRVDKMSIKERNCSLLIESVKLKANLCYNIKEDKIYGFQEIDNMQSTEPATMALTVMIRGLFFNWKQPMGYIFIPQNYDENLIQSWILSLIKKIFEIGLNVRALVSSTKDDWINTILCGKMVSINAPYLLVNDRKIYNVFDAPDIIKSARDCMLLYDIHFENKVVKFQDVINFYNVDQKKSLPYAHKLTNSHINPKNNEKDEAKYAIQLMSNTVANGLWTYIQFGLLENANIGTVEFISSINKLFDILNISHKNYCDIGRKYFCDSKVSGELLLFFQNLKVIDPSNGQDVTLSIKCIKCILITLTSISSLYNDLTTEGHNVLLTRNLQLEALDNFISKLNSCIKGKPVQPTALQFTVAFKKRFFSHLKTFTQRGSSKDEVSNFVAQISHLQEEMVQSNVNTEDLNTKTSESMETSIKISNPRSATENDKKIEKVKYDIIDASEKHSLLYISGYLLMMSKSIHDTCQMFDCYLYLYKYDHNIKQTRTFRKYNQYMQNKTLDLPAVPCDSFVQFVAEMDATFIKMFVNQKLCNRIVESLVKDFEDINFTPPCPCFPKKYVLNLFTRIKILYTIRVNNKSFRENCQHGIHFTVPRL